MVLPFLIREFGLEEKIFARYKASAIGGSQSFTDSGFKVVAALVGGVDGAEAGADGEFSQSRCSVFFPGGAVQKVRNSGKVGAWHQFILHTAFC